MIVLEERLKAHDPDEFINGINNAYNGGRFEEAETLAFEFAERYAEAIGVAGEILTEQRIIDSETEGEIAINDALRFVNIARAAVPGSKRLEELQDIAETRARDIAAGEPIEILGWAGKSELESKELWTSLVAAG